MFRRSQVTLAKLTGQQIRFASTAKVAKKVTTGSTSSQAAPKKLRPMNDPYPQEPELGDMDSVRMNPMVMAAVGGYANVQVFDGALTNPTMNPEHNMFGNDDPNDPNEVISAHKHEYVRFPNKYQEYLMNKLRFGLLVKNDVMVDNNMKDNLWFRELVRYAWAPEKTKSQTIASRPRIRMIDEYGIAQATGTRKTAKAVVQLKAGSGRIFVNKIPFTEYFRAIEEREYMLRPLSVTGLISQMDAYIEVSGSGKMAQAGAASHGIARAIQNFDPVFRPILKTNLLLRRDPRAVERKHAGFAKARKGFTWVKR